MISWAPIKSSSRLAQKWLSYSQKNFAQIWACTPFFGHNLAKYEYFWMKSTPFDLYHYSTCSLQFVTQCRYMHMLKFLIYVQKMDKSGHISIRVLGFYNLHLSIFVHEIFRINVELLLWFFEKKSKKLASKFWNCRGEIFQKTQLRYIAENM